MPDPVDLPENLPQKSETPIVIFVGRFDRRKRIDIFLDLASKFSDVKFLVIGRAHEKSYEQYLRNRWGGLKNLKFTGFVSRFDSPGLADHYQRSWILVNTSVREGLPYTFLEAAGYGLAILSCLDPESFASKYGYFVTNDNFEFGLRYLLEKERWRKCGEKAMAFVRSTWNEKECIDRHLVLYQHLLNAHVQV